ncbi:I78 family peptidase inhibitor [Paracoccus sulfuroxidans]|uniref:Peptidase inhibitor I78 family protein n=1 Tax=Paracoccus sulfuroxidans TaxID=384678 RepID=A0A562NXJ3_9RHOB|nr:I78 family peptidase inhibitor [Paracoccus sulfuroxidans]TWI36720.1 peptidase inhibitor I78 family protein [Paracoccus sulfuroxidans]
MKLAMTAAILAAPLLLAACENDGIPVVVDTEVTPVADACGSANYTSLIGQKSPQISVPAGTVHRSYRTGDPVTMDLNPMRVNFEYDRSGKLIAVSCG